MIKHIEPIQTLHPLATPNLSIALCHGPEVLGGREPNDRQPTWRSLGIGAGTGQRRPQPRAGTAKSGDAWTLCFVMFVQNRIHVLPKSLSNGLSSYIIIFRLKNVEYGIFPDISNICPYLEMLDEGCGVLKKGSSSHSSHSNLPEMFAFELNGDFLRGLIDQRKVAMA